MGHPPLSSTDSQTDNRNVNSAPAGYAGRSQGLSGGPYVARLLIWSMFLLASVVALRVLFVPGVSWHSVVGHTFLEVCGVLIAGAVVYCLWVQYCVSTERWILLATIAFSGLMLGELAHALASTANSSFIQKVGSHYYGAWRITAAFLLIAAARNTARDSKQHCRRIGLQTLADSLAFSVCVTAAALVFTRSWPHVQDTFPGPLATISHYASLSVASPLLIHALCLAALGAAFIVFASRHIRQEDIFSKGITNYLLLAASGQAVRLASAGSFDPALWISHVFEVAALLVLLIELAIQVGISYADAHARIEHLEAVHYMSSHLSNTLDLKVILSALVSDTAGMLSARCASVMLADDAGETLRTVATHGLPKSLLGPTEPYKVEGDGRPGFYLGHTARAFKEKRVCVVGDVYTDAEFIPWRQLAPCDGYSVSVPLIHQDAALGVLNLFFEKHVLLNDERIRLFETLASAASAAITNAQAYEKTIQAAVDASSAQSDDEFQNLKAAS